MPNWIIRQYDSDKCVDEWQKVASEKEVKDLLQQLAAKFLTARELVESGERLVGVRENRGGKKMVLSYGQNPFFTAEFLTEDEAAIKAAKQEPFPAHSFTPEHFPGLFPKKTKDEG